MAVGPAFVLAVGLPATDRGAQFKGEPISLTSGGIADADARAAALAFCLLLEGIARGLQDDVAFGLEHRVVARRQIRACDGDVRVLARALGDDGQVVARGDG
ncbi:hypothetical protein D3C72_2281120 [compost metagenome]